MCGPLRKALIPASIGTTLGASQVSIGDLPGMAIQFDLPSSGTRHYSGCVAENNIFWGCSNDLAGVSGTFDDYNFDSGSGEGETHGITNGSNPFIYYSSDNSSSNYRIVANSKSSYPLGHGLALSAVTGQTLNQDADGNTRGATWDIGAYQYQGAKYVQSGVSYSQTNTQQMPSSANFSTLAQTPGNMNLVTFKEQRGGTFHLRFRRESPRLRRVSRLSSTISYEWRVGTGRFGKASKWLAMRSWPKFEPHLSRPDVRGQ
jgi:hypothetical protein